MSLNSNSSPRKYQKKTSDILNFIQDDEFFSNYYFDLQLFANPEDEGRTEEPTARKRKKAREEGNVPKSQDLVSALTFLGAFWVLWLMSGFIWLSIKTFMTNSFQSLDSPFSLNNIRAYTVEFTSRFWEIIGPALGAGVAVGIISNIAQVGFMFSSKAIEPKFNKISFTFKKIKDKMLFSKQVMFNLLFSVLKFGILSLIFVIIIMGDSEKLINLSGMGLEQTLGVLGSMVLKLFNAAGIFLMAIGIPDYFFKKKQFEDSLKMKKEEVKQEMKEDEGDPMIKGQLQELYQKILNSQSIRKKVPEANVVITNPTHFAVALKYDMLSMPSPMVLAKGEDKEALLIREIAFENDVSVVENPPLARQLYSLAEVGDYIPEEFFMVVAEILIQTGNFNPGAV